MVSTKTCNRYFRMALFRETAERALNLAPNRSDIPALVTHCVEGLRKAGLNTPSCRSGAASGSSRVDRSIQGDGRSEIHGY